ncbi:MAG: hypothetical protein H0T53_15595 [Herpetosiphonaceae bacterium]|nr:hypothetical protein [Herpetosiphonaceae bacterium]
MTYQEHHAAARAAIRRQFEDRSLPVELVIDALLLPAHAYLRQEAAWAFEQAGRGVIFIDYLPLMRDQDQVTGFVAAVDLGLFAQLGDDVHQAVVAAVAAYDPAAQYVTAVIVPNYPPQVITWPQPSALNDLAATLNAAADAEDAPREVQWQPLEMLPTFAFMLDDTVESTEDQLINLTQAHQRPASMDDATILRAERVYTEQREYLDLYAQQFQRWQAERLTPTQKHEITRLVGVVRRMITVTDQILTLIADIKPHTIDAIMRKSDVELGLEAVLDQRPPPRRRRR